MQIDAECNAKHKAAEHSLAPLWAMCPFIMLFLTCLPHLKTFQERLGSYSLVVEAQPEAQVSHPQVIGENVEGLRPPNSMKLYERLVVDQIIIPFQSLSCPMLCGRDPHPGGSCPRLP